MADEEDLKSPGPDRPNDGVGFIVDGIDLREIDVEELEFHPLESFAPDDSIDESMLPPPVKKAERVSRGQHPAKEVPRTRNTNSKLPAQLWPSDEEVQAFTSGTGGTEQLNFGATVSPEAYKEFFNKNVVLRKNFRLTANNMIYYPQISFGAGVKYSGTVTLSQTAMLILAASKTEAMRQGCQEIGCEHILIALLTNHGFAAGQMMLSLHLNAIGKPYGLGDLAGTARKVIDGASPVDFDRVSAIFGGGKFDMCFTAEADQMLVDAMYAAARDGVAAVATKHILSALNDCENEDVQTAFGALYVTQAEIREALKECPNCDDLRQFALYALCSVLYAIIRIRIFQGPIRRYSRFVTRKEKLLKVPMSD
jgi:hypothetical protein